MSIHPQPHGDEPPLPAFRYHPDPLATGSVEYSRKACECCGKVHGYIYRGPMFGQRRFESLCPFCIADGSAVRKLKVSFQDECGFRGPGAAHLLPEVIDEICQRTPGYSGWQQEKWWTHCNDACAFIGAVGEYELRDRGPQVVAEFTASLDLRDRDFVERLDREGSPRGYLFRCRHCGVHGGFVDFD